MSDHDPASMTSSSQHTSGHTTATPGASAGLAPVRLPENIAGYRILRLVAAGGMGAVYEAEQQHPHRVVALKVIRPGYATPELIQRFQMESHALGRLQHPGIAQIYEAGTAETPVGAQPYFAMELIRGRDLVTYARDQRLDARRCLDLIAGICDAVNHAHQRGLVHRDLKPANVLVDDNGQPKILDFGVARAIDSDAQATRQTDMGELVGTLAYMSPEQVLGDPFEVDIRTDVYAIGLILYELLAGALPYSVDRKALPEAIRLIREQDAARLSSVNRNYRGDIETIVAKSLEKDKNRRYASAADLASDIRRFLRDEPIVARAPSTLYHLGKLARRHRALVFGVAAVFVVLVGGMVATSLESVRARSAEQLARQAESNARSERDRAVQAESDARRERDRAVSAESSAETQRDRAVKAEAQARRERDTAVAERKRADTEAATARETNDFLQNDLLAQASAIGQGAKADPELKVRTALDRAAERVKGRFQDKPAVEASIESTIGTTYWQLGIYPEAQRHLLRALDLDRAALGPDNLETLSIAERLGETYRSAGKFPDAESLLRQTVAGYARAHQGDSRDSLRAAGALANVYVATGKLALAEPLLADLLAREHRALGDDDETTLDSTGVLARVYFMQAKYSDAERLLKTVIESRTRTIGAEHAWTIGAMNNLAVLYQREGKFSEAEALYGKVIAAYRRTNGADHPETINSEQNLAVLYAERGRYAEAETIYNHVLDADKRQLGAEHPRTLSVMSNIAMAERGEGKLDAAEALEREVVDVRTRVLGPEHLDTLEAVQNLAAMYEADGKFAQAEPLIAKSVEIRRRVQGPKHISTVLAMASLGELWLDQHRYAEAEALLRECLDIQKQTTPADFRRFMTENWLGASLAGLQKNSEAESLLVSGFEGMQQRASSVSALLREKLKKAGNLIVLFYQANHDAGKASQWSARLADQKSPAH